MDISLPVSKYCSPDKNDKWVHIRDDSNLFLNLSTSFAVNYNSYPVLTVKQGNKTLEEIDVYRLFNSKPVNEPIKVFFKSNIIGINYKENVLSNVSKNVKFQLYLYQMEDVTQAKLYFHNHSSYFVITDITDKHSRLQVSDNLSQSQLQFSQSQLQFSQSQSDILGTQVADSNRIASQTSCEAQMAQAKNPDSTTVQGVLEKAAQQVNNFLNKNDTDSIVANFSYTMSELLEYDDDTILLILAKCVEDPEFKKCVSFEKDVH